MCGPLAREAMKWRESDPVSWTLAVGRWRRRGSDGVHIPEVVRGPVAQPEVTSNGIFEALGPLEVRRSGLLAARPVRRFGNSRCMLDQNDSMACDIAESSPRAPVR